MTNQCIIGPIALPDGRTYNPTKSDTTTNGTEKLTTNSILNSLANNIQGLVTPGKTELYDTLKVSSMKNEGWGVIWFNGASGITDTLDTVRGWGILRKADKKYVNGLRKSLDLEVDIINKNKDASLYMDYTRNDIRLSESDYDLKSKISYFIDDFSTSFDTTKWESATQSGLTGASISTSGGKLQIAGAASVNGTRGGIFTVAKSAVEPPITIDLDLEWLAVAGSNHYDFMILLYNGKPQTYNEFNPDANTSLDFVRVLISASTSTVTYHAQRKYNNQWITYYSGTLALGEKTPSIKITIDENNLVAGYIDEGADGTYEINMFGPGPTDIDFSEGYYIAYGLSTLSSTSATVKSSNIEAYNYEQIIRTVVSLPAGCTPITTPTDYRASSEGNIPVYVNPTDILPFKVDVSDYTNLYDGSVKCFNGISGTPNQIFNIDTTLSPTDFYMTNGLIKLTTSSNSVAFSYWNGTAWASLNTFGVGTITYMQLKELTPEKITLCLNDTEWTLRRGRMAVDVSHPSTALTYTLKNTYVHDGTTTSSPSANADITMQSVFYSNVYNSGDTYRMQIYQLYKTTIKSDSIPASVFTGIGFYDSTKASTSPDYYLNLPYEWLNQVVQRIGI